MRHAPNQVETAHIPLPILGVAQTRRAHAGAHRCLHEQVSRARLGCCVACGSTWRLHSMRACERVRVVKVGVRECVRVWMEYAGSPLRCLVAALHA